MKSGDCRHSIVAERRSGRHDLLALAAERVGTTPIFYMEHPATGQALLGLGSAHTIVTSDPDRLVEASLAARAVLDRCHAATETPSAVRPRFVGGFAFAEEAPTDWSWRHFPSCRLVLPSELWIGAAHEAHVVRTSPCSAARHGIPGSPVPASPQAAPDCGSGDDRSEWIARVERVLAMVADGTLEKAVLARQRTILAPKNQERAEIIAILARLRSARPECHTFWVSAGETHFIGSTPELLVRRRGFRLETQALAGTIARGRSPAEDQMQARRLLASTKNLREHEAVTAALTAALGPVANALSSDPQPSVLALPEALHLNRMIAGELATSLTALELAALVHPTPAVCGWPRVPAYELLATEERGRGWYSGGIGWLDREGDGEFVVALRSGLIDGRRTTLWAGAGIVAGSDPNEEYEETETKMGALGTMLVAKEAISA